MKTLFQMVPRARKGYVPKARAIGHDDDSACYVVDSLVLNTAPHKGEFHGFLKCFTTSYEHKEQANIKLVQPAEEHSIFSNRKDLGW
jgi:hypothetical protein